MAGCNSVDDALDQFSDLILNASQLSSFEQRRYVIGKNLHKIAEDLLYRLNTDLINAIMNEFGQDSSAQIVFEAFPNWKMVLEPGFDPDTYAPKRVLDTSDSFVNLELNSRRALVVNKFYDTYFKNAANAKMFFDRKLEANFVDTFFINRKSGRTISDVTQMNLEVMKLKNSLIKVISKYLHDFVLADFVLQDLFDMALGKMNDLSDLFTHAERELGSQSIDVSKSYNEYLKNPNSKEGIKFRAYLAYTTLKNFDFLVKTTLGEIIEIDETKTNNYSLTAYHYTDKAINMWDSKYGDDVEDVGDIISTISQLLVRSTPRLGWKSEHAGSLSITFADFNTVISKIKRFAEKTQQLKDIDITRIVNSEFNQQRLSKLTISVINNLQQTLREEQGNDVKLTFDKLVARIDQNPTKYFHCIFDLLCNAVSITDEDVNFIDMINSTVQDSPIFLLPYDKEVLWSLYKGIFGLSTLSMFNACKNSNDYRVYEILTLTGNSIYSEEYLLYYRDYTQKIRTRFLKNYIVDEEARLLVGEFHNIRALYEPSYYETYIRKYINKNKITKRTAKWKGKDRIFLDTITYSFGTNDIGFEVTTNGQSLSSKSTVNSIISTKSKTTPTALECRRMWESLEFRTMLRTITGINLDLNPELEAAFKSIKNNNYYQMMVFMLDITSLVLFNHEFNNIILNGTTNSEPNFVVSTPVELQEIINLLYADANLRPKRDNLEPHVELFSSARVAELTEWALAKCVTKGLLSSSQVKTGEGTALANFTLSRLRNSYRHQLERQNLKINSATRNLTFVLNKNGFFEGVFSRREFKDTHVNKTVSQFTAAESFQMSFLYDWITAFCPNDSTNKHDVIREGICGFMPTVNSDKTQIDILLTNLNTIATHSNKAYKDLTISEIEEEITKELGPVYDRIIENTINIFQRVADILKDSNLENYNNHIKANASKKDSLLRLNSYYSFLNAVAQSKKISTETLLRNTTSEYNKSHDGNKISLGVNTHYAVDKDTKTLELNHTLAALWLRLNPKHTKESEKLVSAYYKEKDLGAASLQGFFQLKDFETVQTLLNSKFNIPLLGKDVNPSEKELLYLREFENGSWVSKYGTMVLAKAIEAKTGTTYNILTALDLEKAKSAGDIILVHPMISKYNRMDYLASLQYSIATVGSHLIHGKSNRNDVLLEEAQRWLASNKRNNALTATVHKFLANLLNGVGNHYNVAIIKDIEIPVYNFMGAEGTHKALDGGMFCNVWTAILENYSLGSEHAGIDKKTFGTFYLEDSAAGGQIKTASFACTNDRMRNFPSWAILQKNMSNRRWLALETFDKATNPSGESKYLSLDLTLYLSPEIVASVNSPWGPIYYKGPKFNKELGRILEYPMQFDGLEKVDGKTDTYRIKEHSVDLKGYPTSDSEYRTDKNGNVLEVVINTNWKLFTEVFGGYNSLELKPSGELNFSEHSNYLMVKAINMIGFKKPGLEGEPMSLEDFYQPLKYSDINYCANEGAIKSAGTNFNESNALTESLEYKDKEGFIQNHLNSFLILTSQIGILLDKEHSTDEAEVSMPTLITSACSNRGFTLKNSNLMYKALRNLTETVIEPWRKGIEDLLSPEGDFKGILALNIINSVARDLLYETEDIGALITTLLPWIDKMAKGEKITLEDIKGKVPWSEGSIYSQIFSKISSTLAKKGIKMKFAGTLSVICPTAGMVQLYGDRKFGSFNKLDVNGTIPVEEALQNWQNEIRGFDKYNATVKANRREEHRRILVDDKNQLSVSKKLDLLSKIRFQHNYNILLDAFDQEGHQVQCEETINTKGDFERLQLGLINGSYTDSKTGISGRILMIYEDVIRPRDLAAYDIKMEGEAIDKPNENLVVIKPTVLIKNYVKTHDNAISAIRSREPNAFHYGSPFSTTALAGQILTILPTVMDTSEAYRAWITGLDFYTDSNEQVHDLRTIDPSRRAEIIRQIKEGELDSKEFVYNADTFLDANGVTFNYSKDTVESPAQILASVVYQHKLEVGGYSRSKWCMMELDSVRDLYELETIKDPDSLLTFIQNNKTIKPNLRFSAAVDVTNPAFQGRIVTALTGNYNELFLRANVTGFIGEFSNSDVGKCSAYTTADYIAHLKKANLPTNFETSSIVNFSEGELQIFLQRGTSFKNEPLSPEFKEAIREAMHKGATFVIGDNIKAGDHILSRYLLDIGATYTVYYNSDQDKPNIAHKLGIYEYLKNLKGIDIYDSTSLANNLNTVKKVIKSALYKTFLHDTFVLSEEYEGDRVLKINGIQVRIDPNKTKIIPYELIMSKIHASTFGIDEFDDLQEILHDKEWFTKKNLKKLVACKVAERYFDYELKNFNGEHFYVLSRQAFNALNAKHLKYFKDTFVSPIQSTEIENGVESKVFERVDNQGITLYEMFSDLDKIYTLGGQEIIVTDNVDFYLQKMDYDVLKPSTNISQKLLENTIKTIKEAPVNKPLKSFLKDITKVTTQTKKKKKIEVETIRTYEEIIGRSAQLNGLTDKDLYIKFGDPLYEMLERLINLLKRNGHEIHASFDQSLNIIAGRIPAQSQQSFMILRVVGFDNPNINSAYVSTFQLWLQGSDLDIDAVTLIGSEFNGGGKYVIWSPKANISSNELLKASQTIPYPTGKAVQSKVDENAPSWIATYREFFNSRLLNVVRTDKGIKLRVNNSTPNLVKLYSKFIEIANTIGLNKPDGMTPLEAVILKKDFQTYKFEEFVELDELENLFEALLKTINEHNFYLQHKSKTFKDQTYKNLILYRMYKTAESPSNMAEAMESVDSSTSVLKDAASQSELAALDSLAAPGSNLVKHSLTVQGLVGKDCVSIGAVAIKINSATLFFFDIVLNGDDEEKKVRLLLPANRPTININGKDYQSIANIYDQSTESTTLGVSTQKNEQIRALVNLVATNFAMEDDVAVSLAAFLSIAVDNAKDLALAKLKAIPSMLGMYDYGVSLGMDLLELIQLINSPTGAIIEKYTLSNVLDNDYGESKALKAITKLEGDIYKELNKFNTFLSYRPAYAKTRSPFIKEGYGNSVKTLTDILLDILKQPYYDCLQKSRSKIPDKCPPLSEMIYFLASNGLLYSSIKSALESISTILEVCTLDYSARARQNITGEELYEPLTWKYSFNRLIRWCLDYELDLITIKNDNKLKDLRTLAEGGAEMERLGRFLSSNKGTKTKDSEANRFIGLIENCIIDRIEASGKKLEARDKEQYRINAVKFFYDEEYREQMIDLYELYKHTTNILAVAAEVPHFTGYLRVNVIPYASMQSVSSRARAKLKYGNDNNIYRLFEVTKAKTKEKIISQLDTLINKKYLLGMLQQEQFRFTVPPGFKLFTSRYTSKLEAVVTSLSLNSEIGLANLKCFMEQWLIPKLKNDATWKNNKFVLGLSMIRIDQVPSRNASYCYTLEGDMIPKSDAEKLVLAEYIADFKELDSILVPHYMAKLLKMKPDAFKNNAVSTLDKFSDLFYIYAQYCYGGKKGKRSLLALFDKDIPRTKEKLNSYIAELDTYGDLDISDSELITYCALVATYSRAEGKVFYMLGKEFFGYKLKTKNPALYGNTTQSDDDFELDPADFENEESLLGGFVPKYSDYNSITRHTDLLKIKEALLEEIKKAGKAGDIDKVNSLLQLLVSSLISNQYFLYPDVADSLPSYNIKVDVENQSVYFTVNAKTGKVESVNNLENVITKILESRNHDADPIIVKKKVDLITEAIKLLSVLRTNSTKGATMLVSPVMDKSGKILMTVDTKKLEIILTEVLKDC